MAAFKTEMVSVRDGMFQVEMRCGGRGEPLVWLHHTTGHRDWPPVLEMLAERYMVYQPNHPGWGESTGLDHIDDVVDLAIFYQDLFDTLKIESPYVVGHSLGGMIAAEVAALSPAVRKLVLCNAMGLWRDDLPAPDLFTMQSEEQSRALYFDAATAQKLAPQIDREDREAVARAMFERQKSLAAAAKFLWPIWDKGLKKRIHRIKAPTLIIWGERDGIVPTQYAYEFSRLIPGSRVEVIPETAHMPMFENPEDFVRIVGQFLEA
jgi:pimeloyl-ACP methyl ester carboxylesterase